MNIRYLIFTIATTLSAAAAFAAPMTFPELQGRVTDAANVIPEADRSTLNRELTDIEKRTGHQVVVATVQSLQGREISEYGYQLGRKWGIGHKGKNDGAILLLAPKEHRVRIEVGYGLEPILTDASTKMMLENDVTPLLKAHDVPGALEAGVRDIDKALTPPVEPVAASVSTAPKKSSDNSGLLWFLAIPVMIFGAILTFLIRRTLRNERQSKMEADEIEHQYLAEHEKFWKTPVSAYSKARSDYILNGDPATIRSQLIKERATNDKRRAAASTVSSPNYVPTPIIIPDDEPSRRSSYSSSSSSDDSSSYGSSSSSSSDSGSSSSSSFDSGGGSFGGGGSDSSW